MQSAHAQRAAKATFPSNLKGRVIVPGDTDYDASRSVFYGGLDHRPSIIVRPADAKDVAGIVSFARDNGVELAVRGGGHSLAGHSTTEGGIVLDLRDMKSLEIDAARRTAWAETGLTAAEFTAAAAADGLAVGFGDAGSVGIGGITLGGGVGFLVRKHGLTIDSLLAAEIVTADGRLVYTDASEHPDLFWAIRGGGGNFGVATRLKFQLHELRGIVGGILILPATADTIAGFVAAAEDAPDELSTIANVMPAPPMPFVPEAVHGKLVILGMLVYAGDAAAGERAVAPFRALAKPIADMVRPMQLPDMYPPEDASYHPTAVGRTLFIGLRRSQRRGGHPRASLGRRRNAGGAAAGARRRGSTRGAGGDSLRAPRQPHHGQRRRLLQRAGRPRRPRCVGRPVLGGAPPERPGRVRQFPWRRRRRARAGGIPRTDMGPPESHQGSLRSRQSVPSQPEHTAGYAMIGSSGGAPRPCRSWRGGGGSYRQVGMTGRASGPADGRLRENGIDLELG